MKLGVICHIFINLKNEKMINLVLFGPPGSGKGTQANLLAKKYDLIHLSTGEILRGEIAKESALGLEAKQLMDQGFLVPDGIVIGMISTKLDEYPEANGFIFDGFPRTTSQAEALDGLLTEKNTSISTMLSLQVEDRELIRRLLARGKDSGRADDQNEEIIVNRIQQYNKKTAPVQNYYSKENKLEEIEGSGSIEDIALKLNQVVDTL